jgi:hypothetical protein
MNYNNKWIGACLRQIATTAAVCLLCSSCAEEKYDRERPPYVHFDPDPPTLTSHLKKIILDEFNDISLVTYRAVEPKILMWARYKNSFPPSISTIMILVWAKITDSTDTQSWGLLLLGQDCDSLNHCSEWGHLYAAGFVDIILDSQQVQIRRYGNQRANDSMDKFIRNAIAGSKKIFTSPPTSSEIMRFSDMCGCYGSPIISILTPMLNEGAVFGADEDKVIQTFFSQEEWYKATGDDINSALPQYRFDQRVEYYEYIHSIYENQDTHSRALRKQK